MEKKSIIFKIWIVSDVGTESGRIHQNKVFSAIFDLVDIINNGCSTFPNNYLQQ